MKNKLIYKSEDISFRDVEEKDIEPLRLMHNDPTTLNMLTDTTPITKGMQKFWFKSLKKSRKSRRYSLCTYIKNKEVLIGMIRFDQIDTINQNMLVGLDIIPKFRGKGLGKKSFLLIIDYCFNKLNMHKITLYTAQFNNIAVSLYKKLGFHEEGRLKEHLFRERKYSNLLVMSLFKKDLKK